MDTQDLQKLSESSKLKAAGYPLKREVVRAVSSAEGREYLGLLGPRGAGKTVALLQIANGTPGSFYLSVDTLQRNTDIFSLLQEIAKSYQPSLFLLDEVHFNKNINQALKNAYDFTEIPIVFTSSIALKMHETSSDLSRRVRILPVPYFSFQEYVYLETEKLIPPLEFADIIGDQIPAAHRSCDHLFSPYLKGELCPFSRDVSDLPSALERIIERIIREDIPQIEPVTTDEIAELEQVMRFIGRAHSEDINPSSVARNCAIPRTRARRFIDILERAFLLLQVWPKPSTNVLKEPKILIHPPFRLVYRDYDDAIGGLREDYAVWALQQTQYRFSYLKNNRGKKCPDFLIEDFKEDVVLEVGGKGKGTSQFKGISRPVKKVILKDGPPYDQGRQPLWSLGFLKR